MTDVEHARQLFLERRLVVERRIFPVDGMAGRRLEAALASAGNRSAHSGLFRGCAPGATLRAPKKNWVIASLTRRREAGGDVSRQAACALARMHGLLQPVQRLLEAVGVRAL